jgi:hypothetical protein
MREDVPSKAHNRHTPPKEQANLREMGRSRKIDMEWSPFVFQEIEETSNTDIFILSARFGKAIIQKFVIAEAPRFFGCEEQKHEVFIK